MVDIQLQQFFLLLCNKHVHISVKLIRNNEIHRTNFHPIPTEFLRRYIAGVEDHMIFGLLRNKLY